MRELFFGLGKRPGKQFDFLRCAAVDTGDVDVQFVPDFEHVFGIDDVADLDDDESVDNKIHFRIVQFIKQGLFCQVYFADWGNPVRTFRKPQRLLVVKAFFVGQPVARFAVEHAQADAVA